MGIYEALLDKINSLRAEYHTTTGLIHCPSCGRMISVHELDIKTIDGITYFQCKRCGGKWWDLVDKNFGENRRH